MIRKKIIPLSVTKLSFITDPFSVFPKKFQFFRSTLIHPSLHSFMECLILFFAHLTIHLFF